MNKLQQISGTPNPTTSTFAQGQRPDARLRILRLARLRSAERGLMSTCFDLQSEASIVSARELRLRIEELVELGNQVKNDDDP